MRASIRTLYERAARPVRAARAAFEQRTIAVVATLGQEDAMVGTRFARVDF